MGYAASATAPAVAQRADPAHASDGSTGRVVATIEGARRSRLHPAKAASLGYPPKQEPEVDPHAPTATEIQVDQVKGILSTSGRNYNED